MPKIKSKVKTALGADDVFNKITQKNGEVVKNNKNCEIKVGRRKEESSDFMKQKVKNRITTSLETGDVFHKITQKDEKCEVVKDRRGRPLSEFSGRKACIHESSGYKYLSLQLKSLSKEGNTIYCHYHLGKVDEYNVFHPFINYVYLPQELKDSLIIPPHVNMQLAQELEERKKFIEVPALIKQYKKEKATIKKEVNVNMKLNKILEEEKEEETV